MSIAALNIVSNEIDECGLRVVHALNMGQPVDMGRLIQEACPDHARESVRYFHVWEEALKLDHAYLFWGARQVVDIDARFAAPVRFAALWWIGQGQSLSFSIDLAATLYFRTLGRMPSTAWVQKLPKGAGEAVQVQDLSGKGRTAPVKVEAASWVMGPRFVVVGCPVSEYAPVWKDGGFHE